jgi:hypothetical protein
MIDAVVCLDLGALDALFHGLKKLVIRLQEEGEVMSHTSDPYHTRKITPCPNYRGSLYGGPFGCL